MGDPYLEPLVDTRFKTETCEDCVYRVRNNCRRSPPATGNTAYTAVLVYFEKPGRPSESHFHNACAEWRKQGKANG